MAAAVDSKAATKGYRLAINWAAFWGDWEKTKSFLDQHHPQYSSMKAIILPVLHYAVFGGDLQIVENLLELMMTTITPDESDSILTTTTEEYPNTPFHQAAMFGYTKISEVLVKHNRNSLQIRDRINGVFPIVTASRFGGVDTARYLYEVTIKETLTEGRGRKSGASLVKVPFDNTLGEHFWYSFIPRECK